MELVAIGKDGASHFQLLQNALRHEAKRRVPEMVKIAQSRSAPGVNKTNHRMALGHLSVTERPIALPPRKGGAYVSTTRASANNPKP